MIMWPPRASHLHARVRTTPRLAHSLSSSLALCASVPLCFYVPLSLCAMPNPLLIEGPRCHPARDMYGVARERLDVPDSLAASAA